MIGELEDWQRTGMPEIVVPLRDVDNGGRCTVRVRTAATGIDIACDGLGAHAMLPGHGATMYLERQGGAWRLLVWADINQEDPTHTIDLSGASEVLRRPD